MNELPNGAVSCEWFLNELEGLPTDGPRGATAAMLLRALPAEAHEHAARCPECAAALEDFAETRAALQWMPESLPAPGPWFAQRVMRAITTREFEIEERQNGFWNGVRRLAPRLVAFATLLLMLGGTWAFQERRSTQSPKDQNRQVEGLFEMTPSAPVNDDVIAVLHEEPTP